MNLELESHSSPPAKILTPIEFVKEYTLYGLDPNVTGGSVQNPAFTPSEINFKLLEAWAEKELYLNIDGRNILEWLINPENLEELKILLNRPKTTYNLQNAPFPWGGYWPFPFKRNHIKAFAVFGENGFMPIAYFGGYNLGPDEWLTRHDYMIKITELQSAQTVAALAFGNLNLQNDMASPLPIGDLLIDSGRFGRSGIYNTAVNMILGAKPGSSIVCISPWSPGSLMQKALLTAQQNGCAITYATNNPPLELNGYSVYNLPKFAAGALCKIPLTTIKTEIHGKTIVIYDGNGEIDNCLYTGHCLTDYQNWVGTEEMALQCNREQVIPGTNEYVQQVLADRV